MSYRSVTAKLVSDFKSNSKLVLKIKTINLKQLLPIILKLIEFGYISRYVIKNDCLFIYKNINFINFSPIFICKHLSFITFKKIQSLIYKNPTVVYLVSTTVGILSNNEILKLQLGGRLLLILKYTKNYPSIGF